jgi:antitoxin CptB
VRTRSELRWRCRRGALELDLLLSRYLDQRFDQASEEERSAFERLLTLPDPEILRYLMGQDHPKDDAVADLVNTIRSIPAVHP